MKHRWTIKELKETSDVDIIKTLINERRNELTNPYTPISSRLAKLPATVDSLVATKAELLEALQGLRDAFIHTEGNKRGNQAKTDIIKCNQPHVADALNRAQQAIWKVEGK